MASILPVGVDVTVDSGGALAFLTKFSAELSYMEKDVIFRNLDELGSLITEFIRQKVGELHPLHEFMADRTGSTIESYNDRIDIFIVGVPESEVEGRTKKDNLGDKPYNFWAMFEEGRPAGALIQPRRKDGYLAFEKMDSRGNSKVVFAKAVHQGAIDKYTGMVESILTQIIPDIGRLLASTIFEMVTTALQYAGQKYSPPGTDNPIQVPENIGPQGGGTLNLTGSTKQTLMNLGYLVYVNQRSGQISLRDSRGRFTKQTAQAKTIINIDPNYITFTVGNR